MPEPLVCFSFYLHYLPKAVLATFRNGFWLKGSETVAARLLKAGIAEDAKSVCHRCCFSATACCSKVTEPPPLLLLSQPLQAAFGGKYKAAGTVANTYARVFRKQLQTFRVAHLVTAL